MSLTEEQKQKILNEWNSRQENPPSLIELIHLVFGENFDGRSKEGKLVKDFLATRDIKARASHEYKAKKEIKLTDEQKDFVKNNALTMSAVEMARVTFSNEKLTNLHQETRAVNEYIKSLGDNIETFEPVENVPTGEYKSPKTLAAAVNKIIKFVPNAIDKNKKLSPRIKKNVESLMGFLSTYRFLHTINNLNSQIERDLFESSFIRYTFDKWDLAQEEIDQYIVLSSEVIISSNIQRRIEHLQGLLDATADDTEGTRISMSLVEAISSRQTEYNQSVNRQTKLLDSLKQKRSDRLKKMGDSNVSILNLVEVWKEEEGRKQMIALAEARKEVVSKEIRNLSSMDEIKAKMLGISEDEVLNG